MPFWWSVIQLSADALGVVAAVVSLVAVVTERRRDEHSNRDLGEDR